MKQVLGKCQKILLFLFLIFIPTQLGKHFWPDWSYVLGIRVDYLSPTLYFLDLIWIVLLVLNWNKVKWSRFLKWEYFVFLLFIILNILVASNKGVAIYRWLRVFQLVWTILFLVKEKLTVKKCLYWVIPFWIVFESLLGICQIVKGGSLNGFLYFLGERNFSFNTIGIAQMSVVGQGLIRAYGTFSHPNSLAGFMLVSLLLWMKFKFSRTSINKIWWWVVTWFGLIAILISGSRIIWVLSLLVFYYLLHKSSQVKNKKTILSSGLIFLGLLLMVLAVVNINYPLNNFLGGFDNQSFEKRMSLNLSSWQMIKESFFLGKGLGNFTSVLPNFQKANNYFWLQPVHNVGLLLISETGVLGLVFLWLGLANFLKKKKNNIWNKIIFLIIILTAMWDHYWITLPQNWWLLAVILSQV